MIAYADRPSLVVPGHDHAGTSRLQYLRGGPALRPGRGARLTRSTPAVGLVLHYVRPLLTDAALRLHPGFCNGSVTIGIEQRSWRRGMSGEML